MTAESQIKKQICEWLSHQKCFFWVTQSVGIAGRKNNSPFAGKGVSDILGLWNNRLLAIEVKAPGGKVSQEQIKFIELTNAHGGIAFVAYSLDDVISKLKEVVNGSQ